MTRLGLAFVMLLLAVVARVARADDPYTTVALDLTHLDDRQYAALDGLALEKRLVLRLVQERFAVVGLATEPQVVIRVEVRGDVILLTAEQARRTDRREIAWDREAELDLVHLELSQKVVDLARAIQSSHRPESPGTTPAETARLPANVRVIEAPVGTPRAKAPTLDEPAISFSVEGGVVVRPPAVDPMLQWRARPRFGERWRGELGLGVAPSHPPGILALDLVPLLGLGAEVPPGARWRLGIGLRGGALLHYYALDDPTAARSSGWRVDGLLAVPLRVSVRPLSHLRFELTVAPGMATRGRTHVLDGSTLWHRAPGQLQVMLGMAFP